MPGKRSDPKKLQADREQIAADFARRDRVARSARKALKDAADYKATGEGTMGEAWQNLLDESAQARYVKKYGGPPEVEGAAQVGFKKGSNSI
jgi:hypothetical protein